MPDINSVNINLVQGRWHENFAPILESFEHDEFSRHKELMSDSGIATVREPGLSLKADTKSGSGALSSVQ